MRLGFVERVVVELGRDVCGRRYVGIGNGVGEESKRAGGDVELLGARAAARLHLNFSSGRSVRRAASSLKRGVFGLGEAAFSHFFQSFPQWPVTAVLVLGWFETPRFGVARHARNQRGGDVRRSKLVRADAARWHKVWGRRRRDTYRVVIACRRDLFAPGRRARDWCS